MTRTLNTFDPVLESLAKLAGRGLTLVIGVAGALWSASGYVGAFGRAMNRIYEIDEGRPFWKLRPLMLAHHPGRGLLSALVLAMLVVSGPLAKSIGDAIGLGDAAVTVWSIAKWPLLAGHGMMVVALLYYATPNVKQPKFRWISVGAAVAIVIWVLASVAFAFYVANFAATTRPTARWPASSSRCCGCGSPTSRCCSAPRSTPSSSAAASSRRGSPPRRSSSCPARDTRNIEKAREKEQKDIAMGRTIREQADPDGEVAVQYGDTSLQVPGQSNGRDRRPHRRRFVHRRSPGRN